MKKHSLFIYCKNFTIPASALLLMMFLLLSCGIPSKTKPVSVNGAIDLRGWNFAADGKVPLRGDWKFIWMADDPSFADPIYDDSSWGKLPLKGYWSNLIGTGSGYGWYRLNIKIDRDYFEKSGGRPGIYFNFLISSYELYVNGVKVVSTGRFGRTGQESVPYLIPRLVMIDMPPGKDDLVIALRCSNYFHRGGGTLYAPVFGTYEDLQQNLWRKDFINILLFGIILMMGIYHLFLWIGRRDDRASLYFTVGTLIVFFRLMATSLYFQRLFPGVNLYEFNFKLIYISMPVGAMSFILFFNELFRDDFNEKLMFIFKILNGALILLTLFTSCAFYSRFAIIYEAGFVLVGASMLALTIIAFVRKRKWAAYMVPGCFLILAAAINDTLAIRLVIDFPEVVSFGLAGLVFCQAAVLSNRFSEAYRTAEHLSLFLQDEVENKTRDLKARTGEAEEARRNLEIANASLIEKDSFKSLFFQNITHEFRTPLTLIIGYIEKAISSSGDYSPEVLNAQYRTILLNARRLLKLINQLLDISKIDAGKMEMNDEPLDLVFFIKSIAAFYYSPAQEKKIGFSVQSDTERITGLFDREKIEKIFFNIISNAFKFTDENGNIFIHLKESGGNAVITVRDTGRGIDDLKLPRIFERFYQGDNSSVREYEGTGIGLSLAREYVEMHNGMIEVESVKGEGSVFTVTLPLRKDLIITDDRDTQSGYDISKSALVYTSDIFSAVKAGSKSPLPDKFIKDKPCVLLVEDNSEMREFVREILREKYFVIESENGMDALDKLSFSLPDLVISDIMMPEMNGYRLISEIKKNPATSRIPVILLTAKGGDEEKILGLEYGADDYILKPFSSRELLTRAGSLVKLYRYQKILAERNREIEADLEIAREIQAKLIMTDAEERRDNFSVYYRPLDKVAGDFYIYSENSDTVNILLADVSGHGVASAFLSLVARNELEDLIGKRMSTSSVMQRINGEISRYTVKENFITAFYCIFDKNTGSLSYSRAGHHFPLLLNRADGTVTELKSAGTLLGIFPEARFEEKEIFPGSGNRLVFFTDGMVEVFNEAGDMYGPERLISFARENRDLPREEFSLKLIAEISGFKNSDKFDDDMTMLIFDIP